MTIQTLEYRAAAYVNGRPVFDHETVDNPARGQLHVNVTRRAMLARLLTGRRVDVEVYLDGNRAARHFHDNAAATRVAMHFLDGYPAPQPRPLAHFHMAADGTVTDQWGSIYSITPGRFDRLRARVAGWINRVAERFEPEDAWEAIGLTPDPTDTAFARSVGAYGPINLHATEARQ